jgi:hypothetical protein
MIQCYECPHYLRFDSSKVAEEQAYWDAVQRDVAYTPEAVVTDEVRARAASFLENRLRLNRRLGDNPHHYLPYDNAGHSTYVPATYGAVTPPDVCGSHHGYSACKNLEGHAGRIFHGEDATGMDFFRHKHWWCKNPLCPRCCLSGFAVVRARSMESRFKTAERDGLFNPEHIIVSFLPSLRDVPIPKLKVMALRALAVRSVVGGAIIPHGWRINESCTLQVYSPHFHVLGYVKDGYDMCRLCVGHTKDDCLACSGFNGREMKNYEADRILVSVKAKRETIGGTCWYELNHCLNIVGLKHYNVVSWFGEVACRMFKSDVLRPANVCPICRDELESGSPKHYHPRDVGQLGYKSSFLERR